MIRSKILHSDSKTYKNLQSDTFLSGRMGVPPGIRQIIEGIQGLNQMRFMLRWMYLLRATGQAKRSH